MQDGHQIPLRWEYFLDAHRVDAFHRLKMSQYFLDMQAIAMRHAEELGVGFAALARKSIAWVLTRMLVEVHHMPKLGETYTLSTWANTPNRMLYPRFFRLADASGREAVTASSLWVLIDTEKRRMARPDKADVDMPELGAPAGAYPLPEKLHAPERFDGSLQRRAAYSDFDLNGHMNNARYIEWILDALPMDYHAAHGISRMQVNYAHEISQSAEATMEHRQTDDQFYCRITAQGTERFEALCWFE